MSMNVIPSRVTHIPWIFAEPSVQTILQNYDPEKVGKWMLFPRYVERDANGLSEIDRCWYSIIDLVREGVLIDAKCSTGYYHDEWPVIGVINCYTDDYTKKDKVHAAAESIRKVVSYPKSLYYKIHDANSSKQYRRSRAKGISIYQHSTDHQLYERDESGHWKLIIPIKSCPHKS